MHTDHDEGFLVFVRVDPAHEHRPDASEHLLTECASYAEARRIQRACRRDARECVIRYQGESGGGD
jgi:hypothetical protein